MKVLELKMFFVDDLEIQLSVKASGRKTETGISAADLEGRAKFDPETMEPRITKEIMPSDLKLLVLDPAENAARLVSL